MQQSPPHQIHSDHGVPQNERQWAMFAHLSGLLGYLGLFLANFIAPLIMWQIKKDEMPFGSSQAKEVLNFQLSMLLYGIISAVLIIVVIGFFLLLAIWVMGIVFSIIGAIKANEGVPYRYPLTIRFIS